MATNVKDFGGIIQAVYDHTSQALQVNLVGSGSPTMPNVVRLSDGSNYFTSTTVGPKVGLDVAIVNMPEIIIHDTSDSIKIGNGSGVYAAVNADGSMNSRAVNNLVTVPFDSIVPSYPTSTQEVYLYKTGGVSGTLVATVTVDYVDATKAQLVSVVRT